jgi:hypothetical protein
MLLGGHDLNLVISINSQEGSKESLKVDNSDKHLVTFRSKDKQHSVEKLVENLRKLHLMK